MRNCLARALFAAALAAAAAPSFAQLFDDNEARRRIELLRQSVETSQRTIEERLTKIEGAATDRSALLELSNQLQAMRDDTARMRGQLEVLGNQIESVSLGEEKPRDPGHDEAAWAKNRRSDILYSGEY